MTGGMAYEALNNIGHSQRRVIVVLNDNGRSYAPTVSNLTAYAPPPGDPEHPRLISRIGDRLSHLLTDIRLNPTYVRRQRRLEELLRDVPVVGTPAEKAVDAVKAAVREVLQPPAFFEALGVRYVGPVDGHDIPALEQAFHNAVELAEDGPILVHVITQKGRGYPPAEDDDEKHLHDAPVFDPVVGPPKAVPTGYTQAFAEAVIKEADADSRIVAITAAMAGPTGLLPFQARFPDRFFDVGIAEQHAVTGAAGMAMGGLRPIVAIYSTFLNRAWDQVVYDVALHRLPVVFCIDRAGITGPDGPSHHGVYDMALLVAGAGHARARAVERAGAAADAERRDGPRRRWPGRHPLPARPGPQRVRARGRRRHPRPPRARRRWRRRGCVCILAIGKLVEAAEKAADALAQSGVDVTVWDVRCCAPLDADMLADAARHRGVVTVEDGIRDGGIGMAIEDRIGAHRPGDAGGGPRHAEPLPPPRRPARADPRPARPRRRRNPGRRPPVPLGDGDPPLGPRPVHRRRPAARPPRRSPTRRRSPGAPRSSATSASGSPSTTT